VQRQRPRHPQQTEGPSARRPRQARPRNSPSPNIGRQISSQIRARDDRRYAISTRFFLRRQPGATAAFNVLGHFFHRWSGEYESLTSRKRGFGLVDRSQGFLAPPLALDPQGERFPHSAFSATDPAIGDSAANKTLLLRGQFYLEGVFPPCRPEGPNVRKSRNPHRLIVGHE
jgi:hypothetical protein